MAYIAPPIAVPAKVVRISVYGVGETMRQLYVWDAYLHVRTGKALRQGAGMIRDDARRRIGSGSRHKWRGDLNRAIKVGPLKRRPTYMRVKVGPAHKSLSTKGSGGFAVYPGAYTFHYGWKGKKASQPPTEPLRFWLKDRFGLSEKDAKHKAFVIARNIGKRGYSSIPGGSTPFMRDAARANAPAIVALVAAAAATP
jgi:hypothetical protein